MLSFSVVLLLVIFAIHGFGYVNEDILASKVASTSTSHGRSMDDLLLDERIEVNYGSNALQEREISFKPYSYAYTKGNLRQWIFGNATNKANVSVSSCVEGSDVVGVYQFDNGTMKYDATAKEVLDDLSSGQNDAQANFATRTLNNAMSAVSEIEAYLNEDVLVKSSSFVSPRQRRRQVNFESNGRILALVVKTSYGLVVGMGAAEIATKWNVTKGQLAAGAITSAGLILVYNIIDIIVEDGGLTALEPLWMQRAAAWIANVVMAQLRKLVLLARGAPDHGPARWTTAELQEALAREDILSAWDAGTTPESSSSFGLSGFHGYQCDESPV